MTILATILSQADTDAVAQDSGVVAIVGFVVVGVIMVIVAARLAKNRRG